MGTLLLLATFTLGQAPTAPPQTQPRPTTPPATQPTDYVVGAQDVLMITVFDEPSLTGRFTVDAEGYFNYPFVGRVRAGGQGARSIEEQLRKRLADGYLRNPQVTVEVVTFRSQQVFIMGEVRQPGRYMLEGKTSLLEALALAGSVTQDAGGDVLVIHPKNPSSAGRAALPEDTDTDITRISLRDLQTGKLSQVAIHDADTIFVTRAETIFVTGQVRAPGSYTIQRNMSVLQAISLAGGITERGSMGRIKIQRIVDGKQVEIDAEPEDLVQSGDTIIVNRRLF